MEMRPKNKALCVFINSLLLNNKLFQNLVTESNKIYRLYSFGGPGIWEWLSWVVWFCSFSEVILAGAVEISQLDRGSGSLFWNGCLMQLSAEGQLLHGCWQVFPSSLSHGPLGRPDLMSLRHGTRFPPEWVIQEREQREKRFQRSLSQKLHTITSII